MMTDVWVAHHLGRLRPVVVIGMDVVDAARLPPGRNRNAGNRVRSGGIEVADPQVLSDSDNGDTSTAQDILLVIRRVCHHEILALFNNLDR